MTWHNLWHTWEGIAAISSLAVAAGTALLAVFTWRLARRVKDQTDAARDEVELSRKALQTAIHPLLTDVPKEHILETTMAVGGKRLEVPAINSGTGLALIQEVRIEWRASPPPAEMRSYPGVASNRAVSPGEITKAVFSLGPELGAYLDEILQAGNPEVQFSYTDASGQQPQRTRYRLSTDEPGGEWWVQQVELYRGGDSEPTASYESNMPS